jgi:MFS family permease
MAASDDEADDDARDDDGTGGTWRQLRSPAHVGISAVLAGGVGLHAVNIFLTASLLPTAIGEIGGERLYAWSTTVFMVASVVSAMLVSRVLARRGPAGAYLVALAPFVLGTLVCALAPRMVVLLAGQALQGVGGGLLSGLGYAVAERALPRHLWAKALALVSAMWGVGTLTGPTVGGLFAQFGAWRWAFGLLTVLAVVLAVVAPVVLPRAERPHGSRGSDGVEPVPVTSLLLLTLSTALVSVAGLVGSPALLVALLAGAVVLVVGFVTWERTAAARVLPAATYRSGNPLKWVYLTIGILTTGSASEAFTPLFGQRLAGLEPFPAAFLGAAMSLGWSVSMVFSANATRPRTLYRLSVAGPLVLGLGLAVTGALQYDGAGGLVVTLWFVALIAAGAGIGVTFPHLVVAAMESPTDPAETGKAAAGANTVELIALAFGSAVGGVLLNLGAPDTSRSARYLLLGFAAVALIGGLTAHRSGRPARADEPPAAPRAAA